MIFYIYYKSSNNYRRMYIIKKRDLVMFTVLYSSSDSKMSKLFRIYLSEKKEESAVPFDEISISIFTIGYVHVHISASPIRISLLKLLSLSLFQTKNISGTTLNFSAFLYKIRIFHLLMSKAEVNNTTKSQSKCVYVQ